MSSRAISAVSVALVLTAVVTAARHGRDQPAGATSVPAAAATAWLPTGGALVLADANHVKPVAVLRVTGLWSELAQLGGSAVVTDANGARSFVDGTTWQVVPFTGDHGGFGLGLRWTN